jgi:hypothetical protein
MGALWWLERFQDEPLMMLETTRVAPDGRSASHFDDPRIAPDGPMAPFLGPQLTEREVSDAHARHVDGLSELSPDVLRCIRSFPVLPLVGVEVQCEADGFGDRITEVLTECLPGTRWRGPGFFERVEAEALRREDARDEALRRQGIIEKYRVLDAVYPAPMDTATGQTMVIELAGEITGAAGEVDYGTPLPKSITVRVTHAHWANVSGIGAGVGIYL